MYREALIRIRFLGIYEKQTAPEQVQKHQRTHLVPGGCNFAYAAGSMALQAQTETGQISGTVLDPSGAVITSATIVSVDKATLAKRTITATSGSYVFANLQSGTYEITASAPGFETLKQTVVVAVGSKVGLDSHLTIGSAATVVEVSEGKHTCQYRDTDDWSDDFHKRNPEPAYLNPQSLRSGRNGGKYHRRRPNRRNPGRWFLGQWSARQRCGHPAGRRSE